jgi:hypothetical protein
MKGLAWDRAACIAEVRERIWSYVSPASEVEDSGVLVAAALLNWPEPDALRLGELQFLLSPEVGQFLTTMPQLMRRLTTASTREEQWTAERLLGPIDWSRTLALRGTVGAQHLYVTAPAKRVYQTAENQLLVHVLDAVVSAARMSGWDQTLTREGPAKVVRNRLSKATKWQQSRMLSAVDRVPPTPRSVARIRSSRNRNRYTLVLSAYDRLVSLIEQVDRQAIRQAVEEAGLVTADEPTLFELLTLFHVIDALRACGWQMRPFYLFAGSVRTRGHQQDGRQIRLWYQSTPPELASGPELANGSLYRQVLASHRFPRRSEFRPDMVLQWTDQGHHARWLLVECKLSESMKVGRAARQALTDLLAYRRAFDAALRRAGSPYGLGVAWGEGLDPAADAEVVLCTPDTLAAAVRQIVA